MVFTSMPKSGTITAPATTATSEPGTLSFTRGHRMRMARHTRPTSSACQLKVEMLAATAASLSAASMVVVPAG